MVNRKKKTKKHKITAEWLELVEEELEVVESRRPSSLSLLLLLFLVLSSDSVPATTRYTVPAARAARSAVC